MDGFGPTSRGQTGKGMATIRFGNRRLNIPGSPMVRRAAGVALIGGGVLGFLPVLGFWMIPLGVVVLSVDSHPIRRARRKTEVWWGRGRTRTAP